MGDALLAAFEKVAARKGVTLVLPKRVYFTPDQTWEEKGSILCEKVLRSKVPVDLIIVYPDNLIYGVTQTLLKHRLFVPDIIRVISHRNFESAFWVPFPVTWLTVKIEDYARALLKQIDQQIAGEELTPIKIPVRVELPPPVSH